MMNRIIDTHTHINTGSKFDSSPDRILFGTDTYAAGAQKGRIEYALISKDDKENILWKNAEKLFEKYM